MVENAKIYDVAIIGSGIGGSTLAAILARQGLSVIVFEAQSHPKFSIGESMILETSEMMRALAEFYEVPELAYFSSENYFDFAGTSHGIKRHFGFVHHKAGEQPKPEQALQAVIPKQPYGHELHLYRQDTDYFLTSVAISYGVTVLQNTPVSSVQLKSDDVAVTTLQGDTYLAQYIVDAGGFKSLLANQFNLRELNLKTHTRGMFTHMVDVPFFNDTHLSPEEYGVPFRWSEGTLHHHFEGGWIWIIPFNNHAESTNPLCSVGLLLDPRVYPAQNNLSAEDEFNRIIKKFPAIEKQFENSKAVRSWVRAGRLQYSSKKVVGDRFALLGHAAGFIDPLFSKGLYGTHMSIMVLADLLLKAKETNDFSEVTFAPLEKITLNYVNMNDRLISNSIKSWGNHKLWRVYSVQWLLGAYLEYLMLNITRMRARSRSEYISLLKNNQLAGGGFKEFFDLQEKIDTLFENVNPTDDAEVDRMVAEANTIFSSFKWLPKPFQGILDGKNHLAKNKFRLSLLNKEDGFMGSGTYRRHFFGNMSLYYLLKQTGKDLIRYSLVAIKLCRRRKTSHLVWRKK